MALFLVLLLFASLSAEPIDLRTVTVEEKVGQLLLVHFTGEQANESATRLLKEAHIGGFIYYEWANQLSSPYQVQKLSLSLQKLNRQLESPIPLLIAIDQEGGRVNRLKKGFTSFPSQAAIAQTGLLNLEQQVATAISEELLAVGINLNCAPVVDINGKSSVINDRAFGSDPLQVTRWGFAALKGYRKSGMIATLKHFPGHGDVRTDSHSATPVVKKSLEELEKIDLYPFAKLAHQADAIMTGHLLVPALDNLPATLAPIILDKLRTQYRFQGVIISDSLVMKGLSSYANSIEELALQAFLAGCDILCLGGKLLNEPNKDELKVEDVLRIHRYLVQAVAQGKISMDRLDQSVERIIQLKKKYGLGRWEKLRELTPEESLSSSSHTHLKEEVLLLSSLQNLSPENQRQIGEKIWKNECNGTLEGLLTWNAGEECLSLGIGHFIWYPAGKTSGFDAAFPQYLAFLKNKQIAIPPFITTSAPWQSRDEFLAEKNSELAHSMRTWLTDTIDLQTEFMIKRLSASLNRILAHLEPSKRTPVLTRLQSLAHSPIGIFALIDYLNFKGEGLSLNERYQGQGWGLYQVLLGMHSTENPLEQFQQSAINALTQRVALSPPERNEARWLEGWKNRINRYK